MTVILRRKTERGLFQKRVAVLAILIVISSILALLVCMPSDSIADAPPNSLPPTTPSYPIQQQQQRDARLPQRPKHRVTKSTDKILVVYSGPTHLPNREILNQPDGPSSPHSRRRIREEGRKELYRVNFEYFLTYGTQCQTQDTVIVVTKEVEEQYRERVHTIQQNCHDHKVILAIRENKCFDLETVRRVMHDDDIAVDIDTYDYFVYVNCGVSGPSKQWADLPWTDVLIDKLNDHVKMSGLTLNCGARQPHVQSMVFALDRVALQFIKQSSAIFDCYKRLDNENKTDYIVRNYEFKMGRLLLDQGYGLEGIIHSGAVNSSNKEEFLTDDRYRDMWITSRMMKHFGRILSLEEAVFFKTSRLMSPEIAMELNYNYPLDWNW